MSKETLLLSFLAIVSLATLGTLTVLGQESSDQVSSPLITQDDRQSAVQDPAVPADQVVSDDQIINGSVCVGFDCTNNQDFDFDSLILKENNLRIFFHDTSTSTSFPTNDWRIEINSSENGGDSYFRIDDVTGSVTAIHISPGGNTGIGTTAPTEKLHVAGNILADGSITELSDAHAKINFAPVSGEEILENLSAVPITTWSYKSGNEAVRHIGPTAQDFYAAFGLGADDRHISTIDRDGVALAAIQQLTRELTVQEAEIERLEQENQALADQYAALEARLAALEDALAAAADQ